MFCTKCGKEINDEAVICPSCGCPTHNYKAQFQSQQATPNIIATIAQRYKINGIIWIVIAALQLIIGICGAWFTLIVGALNLYSAIQDINYSKGLEANPVGIVDRVKPMTNAIITLVFNLVIGGIIGVAGSIYYLVAVRGFILENEESFKQIEEEHI